MASAEITSYKPTSRY